MALTAVIICIGVIWKDWPNDELARLTTVILSFSKYVVPAFGEVSPGRSIPVFSVKPNASKYL